MKNDSLKMVITLTVIATISSLLLAGVFAGTKDAIAEAYRKEFLAGLSVVLPAFDNEPDKDVLEVEGRKIYIGKQGGEIQAYAVQEVSRKGYGGEIAVLVGVGVDGKISGVQVLRHAETPGLGDKILLEEWRNTFKGLSADDRDVIAVKKDGGDIDQFSGATISPRAVAEAVRNGVGFVDANVLEKAK